MTAIFLTHFPPKLDGDIFLSIQPHLMVIYVFKLLPPWNGALFLSYFFHLPNLEIY